MSTDKILSRLEGVRQTTPDRWRANCPMGHTKNKLTLSVIDAGEGRIKLHCFGGCDAPDVLAAIGLHLSDLYPATFNDKGKPARPNHWHMAREALRTLHREVLIVAIAAENIAAGVTLDEADRELVVQAASKIRATAEICS